MDNKNDTNSTPPPSKPLKTDDNVPREAYFIKSLAGWATLKAVSDLLQGGLIALSVIGMIVVGVILAITKGASEIFLDNLDIGEAANSDITNIFGSSLTALSIFFLCIGIASIFLAVFKIMAAIKLLKAVDKIREYLKYNLFDKIYSFMYDLSKHFKYSGINIIIYVALTFIVIAAYILLMIAIVNSSIDILGDSFNFQ